jgi:glycosyltransferase involved in cell wall biosynthesis
MKIFIADTINNIPSHKQFQDLGIELKRRGHIVCHYSDTRRYNYGVDKVITIKKGYWSVFLLLKEVFIERPDIVVSTFRTNLIFDVLSSFFSFRFYPVFQSDLFTKKLMHNPIYRNAVNVITVSSILKDKIQLYFKSASGKVINVGNSVDFCQRTEPKAKKNIITFVGNASLNTEGKFVKGIDNLLGAWNKLNLDNWTLKIIGVDKFIFEDFESKNVEFLGFLSNKKVIEILSFSKVFVLPSRNDAMPNAFIEAMSQNCSLIGTLGTGAVDIIVEGNFGYLVRKEDENQLAEAIFKATNSYTSQEDCGNTYLEQKKYFSREQWINRMVQILEKG